MASIAKKYTILAGVALGACAAATACSTSDGGAKAAASAGAGGGSAGSGASGAGGSGTAGSGTAGSGTAGAGPAGVGVKCLPVTQALITDFTFTPVDGGSTSSLSFGDFTMTFSGSPFIYGVTDLKADFSGNNWHISGPVGDYSGINVDPLVQGSNCNLIDATGYTGISFTLMGTMPAADTLTLQLGFAPDDVTAAFLNAHKANATDKDVANYGGCTPVSNQYDGTCGTPAYAIPNADFGTAPQTVTVHWTDFTGGKPVATVDPSQITSISGFFTTPSGVGTSSVVAYNIDITIDDLKFITN
ncbi:MAG TPA: hypothetical protein VGI10_09500 [Polyangiaceae bacterium]|jgi:hypothetical protein